MSLLRQLSRIGPRLRVAVALTCLLLAAVTALEDSRGTPPPAGRTVVLVVATRDLPAGHTLGVTDLALARWPARQAPPGTARSPARLRGRAIAGPLAAGEPVTTRRLVDPGLTAGLRGDVVALPVDLDTDVRGLVPVGGRVDLLAVRTPDALDGATGGATGGSTRDADGGSGDVPGAERVAGGVRVLAVLATPTPLAGTAGTAGCRLVLAVDRAQALRAVALRPVRLFTVVVDPP